MSDNIPFDIQLEIIKKVSDVKSMIRFRSVSKPWKAYIDSSKFISGYGVRDTQPHRLLLRYKEPDYLNQEIKYISFVNDVTFPKQEQDFSLNVPLLIKQIDNSEVIGSSCGLWCFHDYENDSSKEMIVFWNPSIRKSVGIVVPSVLTISSGKLTHFGFGVCPSTYDPTIVAISWYLSECKNKVEIFTLSSKTWKMIPTCNMPRGSIRLRSPTQVAIDRFIFWVARIVGNYGAFEFKNLILSFDLISHKFKEVNLPFSIANFASKISISKLNESLVVSANTNEVNGLVYSVWMMGEEGGAMTSFTKLFTIKTPDDLLITKVLGFTISGEPILETGNDYADYPGVEIYKLCSQQIIFTGIEAEPGSSLFVSPYAETLLLVDHSDCCIISNDS